MISLCITGWNIPPMLFYVSYLYYSNNILTCRYTGYIVCPDYDHNNVYYVGILWSDVHTGGNRRWKTCLWLWEIWQLCIWSERHHWRPLFPHGQSNCQCITASLSCMQECIRTYRRRGRACNSHRQYRAEFLNDTEHLIMCKKTTVQWWHVHVNWMSKH